MTDEIPFHRLTVLGTEQEAVLDAIARGHLSGGQHYSRLCERWMERRYAAARVFLTPSCSHALEMAALLCGIRPGDEVIMPSFTFTSTANAFALRGAAIRFVDIRPDTQNIDEALIEAAITPRTKAIVPVHYAGVACRMDVILDIARAHGVRVVEDAAQGVQASFRGKALGTWGDYGCYSFHETKNYTMGEGGALLLKDGGDALKAAVIRDKGTNRAAYLLGMVDKYTWVSEGSSYLPGELGAAYLYAQLLGSETIDAGRLRCFDRYAGNLRGLATRGRIALPVVPEDCQHNGHIFYIKAASLRERDALIRHLKARGIAAAFHYVPLHLSEQGRRCGTFVGEDRYTTDTYRRLLRLPMYHGLTDAQVDRVCACIEDFYRAR